MKAAVTAVPKQEVKVGADTTPVTAAMTRVRAELAAVTARVANIKFGADDTAMAAAVAKMLNKVALLDKQMRSMELAANPARLDAALAKEDLKLKDLQQKLRSLEMGADTGKIDAQIAREVTAAAGLQRKLSGLQLTLEDAQAVYELKYLEDQAEHIRKALEKIPGDVEDALLKKKLDVITGRINVIRSDARRIELAANTTLLFAQLTGAEDRLVRLRAEAAGMRLMNPAQIASVQAQIAAVTSEVRVLRAEADRIRLGGLNMAEITSVAAGIAGLNDDVTKLSANLAGTAIGPPGRALGELRNQAAKLNQELGDLDPKITDAAARAALTSLQLQAEKLKVTLGDLTIGGDPVAMAAATRDVAALAAGLERLQPAEEKASGLWERFMARMAITGGGRFGLGGTIAGIGIWHVALDGVIEAIIAVTGAAIAAAAGAAVLAETAKDVATRLNAVRTVNSALGAQIPPLTGKFDNLVKAMAPRGIEIFGGALNAVNSQSRNLQKVIEPVVDLFAKWVAEIDIWVAHQASFAGAITHGTTYLAQFGQIIGNITEAIHNLLSKDPGIAHYLMDILVAVSGLFDAFTKLPKPIVELTIGLHGLYVWAAVLSAVFLKMLNPVIALTGKIMALGTVSRAAAAEIALLSDAQLASAATSDAAAVSGLGGALGRAGGALKTFGAGLGALAANPLTWLAGAAALITAMVIDMHNAGNAAKDFIGKMNDELNAMKASDAIPAIEADIGQLNDKIRTAFGPENIAAIQKTFGTGPGWGMFHSNLVSMGDAAVSFGHVVVDVFGAQGGGASKVFRDFGGIIDAFHAKHNAAMHQAGEEVKAYDAELTKLKQTQGNYFQTIGALIKEHYSVASSFALMDLAGVKASDSFEVMHQKVENLIDGYKAITGTGGALEASVNAVTFAALQQQEKVSQLNSGWDAFMKTIEGGESTFVTFATQTEGLYQSLSNAGVKLSDSNGKVGMSTKLAADAAQGGKVSMTGLNTASLQARDTFLKTADAANQQMDALSVLANAAGLGDKGVSMLGQANKDLVATMLPAAKGSVAMTDILYGLAQRGGYKGADSFKALSQWVGKTRDPMKELDSITTTFTTDASDLAGDVKNLSVALGTTLNAAMAQAIITANGGQAVFTDFASAVLKTGANTKAVQDAAVPLAQSLLNLTGNAKDAKAQFETFARVGLHLTKQQADTLWQETLPKLHDGIGKLPAKKTIKIDVKAPDPGIFAKLERGIAGQLHLISHDFDTLRHDVSHIWDLMWNNTIGRLNRGVADSQKLTAGWEHGVAGQFDLARHDIAHIWDLTWNNALGRLNRWVADSQKLTAQGLHGVAGQFDTARHDIAHIWDLLWNNTIGRLNRGIADSQKLTAGWEHDFAHWFDVARHDVAATWDGLWGDVTRIWNTVVRNTWDPIKTFLTVTVPGWFTSCVSAVHNAWSGIVNAISGPLRTVAHGVLHGFFSAVSAIADFVGLKSSIGNAADSLAKLAGGGYIAGGSGPTADDQLAWVSRGELVVPANMVSAGAVDHLRGHLPGFAAGGPVNQAPSGGAPGGGNSGEYLKLFALAQSSGIPGLSLTSGYRPGGTSAHAYGDAADISAYDVGSTDPSTPMNRLYQWIFKNYHNSYELIHWPYGGIKQGRDVPGTFWGMPTWLAHQNHVHWALDYPGFQGGPGGKGILGSIAGFFGGIVRSLKDIFSGLKRFGGVAIDLAKGDPGKAAKDLLGMFAPTAGGAGGDLGKILLKLPVTLADKVAHFLVDKAKSFADSQQGAGGIPGAAAAGSGPAQQMAKNLLKSMGWPDQWPAFNSLVMSESGWNVHATNPSSGAYGLPQALPASKMASAGADWHDNPATQLRWMMGYIKSTYGDPNRAYSTWLSRSPHWYGSGLDAVFSQPTVIGVGEKGTERVQVTPAGSPGFAAGGAVPGMAAGGTVGDLRTHLAAAQAGEHAKYFGLVNSIAADLARAKPGSYTASHRVTLHGELGTLAKRQAAEDAAYKALSGSGLTTANLAHLGSMARAEASTALDQALTHQHPLFAKDLRGFLGTLSALGKAGLPAAAASSPAAVLPGWPQSSRTAMTPGDFWSQLAARQEDELTLGYGHVVTGFRQSAAAAKPGTWAYANRKTIASELATLAQKQAAEAAAYKALGTPGTVPSQAALSHLIAALKTEGTTSKDKALSHVPGGHPALMAGLYYELGQVAQTAGTAINAGVTASQTLFSIPGLPAKGTARYDTLASIYGFDRGGILPPGLTLAYNGTGRNEVVSAAPPGAVYGPGGMTPGELQVINRLDRLISLMGAAPAAYSQALSGVAGQSASRGYFGGSR